ncbi:MAG TPA: GrpB family protein [Pyrinomonadaceae bacterium]
MARVIEVKSYDVGWPLAFEAEAAALSRVFGDSLVAIHHIGSTSIPGLLAKPIIDILVILTDTETIDRFSGAMEGLGYRVRGECLDAEIPGTPGRFYFSKDTDEVRTHHVHVCALGHAEIADKLAFRDYLRAHPHRAAAYGSLKQRLALTYRHDNVGYMRGKDAFIKTILDEARRWSNEE